MNRRTKRVLMILAPASAILTWRVYVLFSDLLPAHAGAAAPTPTALHDAPPVPAAGSERMMPDPTWTAQAVVQQESWRRDPFFPSTARLVTEAGPVVVAGAPQPPDWRLTGIAASGEHYTAILDDRVVRIGSVLEDAYRVTDITDSSVLVRNGNWQFRFRLGRPEVEIAEGDQP